MFRVGGTCLYTLDSGDQTIYPYGLGTNGQLTIEVNSTIPLGTVNATSLNVYGSNVYITDSGSKLSTGGAIFPYTTGASLLAERAGRRSGGEPAAYVQSGVQHDRQQEQISCMF